MMWRLPPAQCKNEGMEAECQRYMRMHLCRGQRGRINLEGVRHLVGQGMLMASPLRRVVFEVSA